MYEGCGTWDEASSRWTTDANVIHQQAMLRAAAELDSGKMLKDAVNLGTDHFSKASVTMSDGLKDWSAENAKLSASMKAFDKSLEGFQGSVLGLSTSIALGATGGQATAIDLSGLSGGSTGAAAANYSAIIASMTGVKPGTITDTASMQAAINAYVKSSWGRSSQSVGGSGSSWGGTSVSGMGGWVGSGASSSGIGAIASGLASGGFHGNIGSVRFAEGGIITKPTLAMIGEAGEKEAVVPLSKAAQMGFGGQNASGMMVHTQVVVNGRAIADAVGPAIVGRLQAGAGLKVR
jgi:hypothetical protein